MLTVTEGPALELVNGVTHIKKVATTYNDDGQVTRTRGDHEGPTGELKDDPRESLVGYNLLGQRQARPTRAAR